MLGELISKLVKTSIGLSMLEKVFYEGVEVTPEFQEHIEISGHKDYKSYFSAEGMQHIFAMFPHRGMLDSVAFGLFSLEAFDQVEPILIKSKYLDKPVIGDFLRESVPEILRVEFAKNVSPDDPAYFEVTNSAAIGRQFIRYLRDGRNVFIFPESTREHENYDRVDMINAGQEHYKEDFRVFTSFVDFSDKYDVPVVPMLLATDGNRYKIILGKPVSFHEMDKGGLDKKKFYKQAAREFLVHTYNIGTYGSK